MQCRFVASAGPGVVPAQVEAPGLFIELLTFCVLSTAVEHQVPFQEEPPSSVQPPWLLLVCFPENSKRINLGSTLCLCSSSNTQPWQLWKAGQPWVTSQETKMFKEFMQLAALSFLEIFQICLSQGASCPVCWPEHSVKISLCVLGLSLVLPAGGSLSWDGNTDPECWRFEHGTQRKIRLCLLYKGWILFQAIGRWGWESFVFLWMNLVNWFFVDLLGFLLDQKVADSMARSTRAASLCILPWVGYWRCLVLLCCSLSPSPRPSSSEAGCHIALCPFSTAAIDPKWALFHWRSSRVLFPLQGWCHSGGSHLLLALCRVRAHSAHCLRGLSKICLAAWVQICSVYH